MNDRYRASLAQLARAEQTIPLGSQTFSKSRTALPAGAAPLYVTRGRGGRVWDVDGHEYVDLVCGLACVLLGYRDPEVDAAIVEQLAQGITFSLPHPLEAEVAEALVSAIPCAERVRFGKNGSDATTAAVRVARAFTGREAVLMCGYHGWQDWSIGTTARHAGVPLAVRGLTATFPYGDLDAVAAALAARSTAAVVLEPMNLAEPPVGFLAGLRALCDEFGALLVFDETVTGFRYALGGAQEHFGVTPDLATFGKGLGNGMPISVIVGRADVMRWMEEVFFSTTFGGETLSLAAARAVLRRLATTSTLHDLAASGRTLVRRVEARIAAHGAGHLVKISGHPTWSFLQLTPPTDVSPWELRTLFLERMCANGVLTLGTHNLCAAHDERDLDQVVAAYDAVLPELVEAVARRDVRRRLGAAPLEPLFQVRPSRESAPAAGP